MKKFWKNISYGILFIYGIGVTGFVPYYNWNYAKNNGFMKWVLFGEIVATAKGIAWPVFVAKSIALRDDTYNLNGAKPGTQDYNSSFEKFRLAMYIITVENNIKMVEEAKVPYNEDIVKELSKLVKMAKKCKDKDTANKSIDEFASCLKKIGVDDHKLDIHEAVILDRWNQIQTGVYKLD